MHVLNYHPINDGVIYLLVFVDNPVNINVFITDKLSDSVIKYMEQQGRSKVREMEE